MAGGAAAALVLHALVLSGADGLWPSTAPPPLPAPTLDVRVVAPAPMPPVEVEPKVAATAPPTLPSVPRARPATKMAAAVRPAPTASQPPVPTPRQAEPVAAAPAGAEDESTPLYRTRLPPAVALRYEVSRGALRGIGELVWRPGAAGYALTLDFKLSGLTLLSQSSTGVFDEAGIAPQRFTDQRPRRSTTAANFRRDAGRITYSGSPGEFALKPGAQDRLSWMVQLAAVVAAEPQLSMPGARVVMQVTGSRGDAGLWVFRCLGAERVDARGGAIEAIKFLREPREAYDATIEVWLDPEQHHLPVRATQKSGAGDEGYELRLLDMTAPS